MRSISLSEWISLNTQKKCKLTGLVPRENTNDRREGKLREKAGEMRIDEIMIFGNENTVMMVREKEMI
jgi:hypothetical protein